MTYEPGETLTTAWPKMTPDEKKIVVNSLRKLVDKMRRHSRPHVQSQKRICNVEGGGLLDPLFSNLPDNERGPFNDVPEFHATIEKVIKKKHDSYYAELLVESLGFNHPIVFTHGDLAPRNILVSGTTIVSLLDWEFGGFYPAYWETQKIAYTAKWDEDWVRNILEIASCRRDIVVAWVSIRRIVGP